MAELNAAQELLLAAADLSGESRREFSEWDLTVRVWTLNKNRFGCRGYEDQYPDHKRVMMELMGSGKLPRERGWLEKTRKNHYGITSLGLAEAAKLGDRTRGDYKRQAALYDQLVPAAFHPVFIDHLQNEEEPKTWLGGAAFLALSRNDAEELNARLRIIRTATTEALAWMDETGQEALRRGDAGSPISKERLSRLRGFLDVLEERFRLQMEAIRGMKAKH